MEFSEVIGKEFDFYGAAENQFKIGNSVWLVVEDEDGGYRSYLDSIQITTATTILFNQPIAKIRVDEFHGYDTLRQKCDLYYLVDISDAHAWLTFGTRNTDDYYPYFVFDYTPKPAKEENALGDIT